MKKTVKNREAEEFVAGTEGLTAMPSIMERFFSIATGSFVTGMLTSAFCKSAGAFDYRSHKNHTLEVAPNGNGEPVMVIAGFTHDDSHTEPWRDFLNNSKFCAIGTETGEHGPPDRATLERMLACFDRQSETHGGTKIALVGHSLGGAYARAIARLRPQKVSHVIFVASPVNAKADSGLIFTYFERVKVLTAELAVRQGIKIEEKINPRIPVTAIYCRRDEIVGTGRDCRLAAGPRRENIVVESNHCDLLVKPEVMMVLADRLRHSQKSWKPFNPADYPGYHYIPQEEPAQLSAPIRRHKDETPAMA